MNKITLLLGAIIALPLLIGSTQGEILHNYYTIQEDTEELANMYPDIAIYREHGESSLGGLSIFSVDVALNITELSEEELRAMPTMYVDAAHHGNEQMAVEAAYFFLKEVLEKSASNPAYLEGKRLVVTPVVNADGYSIDCRNNAMGVDLNRNYPYMWGEYGTSGTPSFCPASGTYRGSSAGSEIETQANMELMSGMNMYVYLSGHTGSNDIVLPWKITGEYAVEIPDWELYEQFLETSNNVSGLGYRDPSGAGESIAWGYGARTAVSVIVEVDELQWIGATLEDARGMLDNELKMYEMVWENLTLMGGNMEIKGIENGKIALMNMGWGAAYNITYGKQIIGLVESGEEIILNVEYETDGSMTDGISYNRMNITGEEESITEITISIKEEMGIVEEENGIPYPNITLVILTVVMSIMLRNRND